MKKLIYLIQGQAKFIKNYLLLKERKDIDVMLLTYDEQIHEAIYFPNSTWGQGRNLLLEKALARQEGYQYYIFLDDDVRFLRGGFSDFEAQLVKYKPAIAMPVFSPKTESRVLGIGVSFRHRYFVPISQVQLCKLGDAQFLALHKDVIADRLVVPLQTDFDDISWHATSSTQQLLMLNLYRKSILQFNNIVVVNDAHRQYPKNSFKEMQKEWFAQQFVKPIRDPRRLAINLLSLEGLRRLSKMPKRAWLQSVIHFFRTLFGTMTYKDQEHYHIPEEKLVTMLRRESVLFNQYRHDINLGRSENYQNGRNERS